MKKKIKNINLNNFILALFLIFLVNSKALSVEMIYKLPIDIRNQVFFHLSEGNYNEVENILKQEYYVNPDNMYMLALADFYIDTDQYSKAESTIKTIYAKDNNNPEIRPLSSKLLYKTMQYDKANEYAKISLQRNKKSSNAYLSLGNVYLEKAKKEKNPNKKQELLDESQKNFFYAEKYNPNSAESHVGMAKVYIAKNRKAKAFEELLIADEMGVYSPETQYFIGEFFYKEGNLDKAVYSLKKPILYNYNKDSRTHYLLGSIYEKLGKFEEAKKEYESAKKIEPQNQDAATAINNLSNFINLKNEYPLSPMNTSFQNNQEKLYKADNYLIKDMLADARNLYLQVLGSDPENIEARASLMELYYSQTRIGYLNPKNFFNDNKYFENPNQNNKLKIPYLKISFISTPNIPAKTKKLLNEMIENSSNEYYDLLNSARASFLLEDYNAGVDKLNNILNLSLTKAQMVNIAKSLYLDRNFYDAKNILESLIVESEDEIIVNLLEMIDSRQQKIEELLNQSIQYTQKKSYDKAIRELQECQKFFPNYCKTYVELALAYYKIGNYKMAKESINKYNELKYLYPQGDSLEYAKKAEKLFKSIQNESGHDHDKQQGKKEVVDASEFIFSFILTIQT